ncbi:MAG: UvrD-helicase domain-containing protein [Gemmatimonadota bacterium]|nr:UvrD-helicase domain-containing protein [Gemmatimonadota bacterium]
MNLRESLNPNQLEAAEHIDGPLLILAGAGSGKTRVLTHRVAQLIDGVGLDPQQILALTFTNKAAKEMRERIDALLGDGRAPNWVGTFHAISTRILRREAENFGLNRYFVIYDGDDQLALIKRVMKELNLSDKQFAPEAIRSYISGAKDQLINPEDYADRGNNYFEQNVSRVYTAYQNALSDNNALDFDDLIMQLVVGFENVPSLLEHYQERFQFINVDEYQDTNHAQYRLINLLAKKYRNLCVVGDDDQSIYAWRGADIKNILEFEKDYPESKVVRLEQNYRSTKAILEVGNTVIKNNKGRTGKELWTENPPGDQVVVIETMDERDEGREVTKKIREEMDLSNRPLRDFTVLYRTNAQSRALEDELRRASMPYVIVGGLRFFERKEVKDILGYLKVIVNPRDSVSFRRIVNTPPRGLGNVSVEKIETFALAQGLNPIEGLVHSKEAGLTPSATRSAQALGTFLADLAERQETVAASEITEQVIKETSYLRELEIEAARSVEAETRAQNVRELLAAVEEFSERTDPPLVRVFLEEAALVSDFDRWDESVDRVTLMTLHNAKGLEFPFVFIAGMEDGLFPISRAMESQNDLEEERRLFYVGITRARERLYISYANLRRRFGGAMPGIQSRFLSEIPEELVEKLSTVRHPASSWGGGGGDGDSFGYPQAQPQQREASTPFGSLRLAEGKKVRHPVWGDGQVMQINGSGSNMRATIRFGGVTKKVMVKYAALETIK